MEKSKLMRKASHLGFMVMLLFTLLFFSVDAYGQTNYPELVSVPEAQFLLDDEIPVLSDALDNLTQGSSAYQTAERKLHLYVHTFEGLVTGETVEDALTGAYAEFAVQPNGQDADQDELPQSDTPISDFGDPKFNELVAFLSR